MVPATPVESGLAFDVIRAALATVVASLPGQALVLTEADRGVAKGVLLRVVYDADGTIHTWIEQPTESQRQGVVYTQMVAVDPDPLDGLGL